MLASELFGDVDPELFDEIERVEIEEENKSATRLRSKYGT